MRERWRGVKGRRERKGVRNRGGGIGRERERENS